MNPVLRVNDLCIDFIQEGKKISAVRDISFSLFKNQITAVVGESGSGKSVTALSILRLLPPAARITKGEILFSENENSTINLLKTNDDEIREIRGKKISMIFQEPMTSLNPVFSCGSQLMESILTHQKLTVKEARELALYWLEQVRLPDPPLTFKKYPHQLSGGQRQRIMIAMALCCNPSLLICDEPTSALDVCVQKNIIQLIKELQQKTQTAVLFITHDLGVVAEIADNALVLYKGNLVEQNDVKMLFRNPHHPYTKALLACRPVNHPKGIPLPTIDHFLKSEEEAPIIRETARPKKSDFLINPVAEKEVLLSVKNLSVRYPTKRNIFGKPVSWLHALENINFDIYKGETLGIVGESGCGKTTLGRALLRLINVSKGEIFYKGTNLLKIPNTALNRFRKEIQIVFQDPYSSLNPKLRIREAIAEPLNVHHIIKNPKDRNERVNELLLHVQLKREHAHRYPHEFSGGQRQRIVMARALSVQPSFIVFDESVSALDVSVQAHILNLIHQLKEEFGFTVVFISHDLSVVRYMSDRILVMQKGKIVETGTPDEIFLRPQSPYTRHLISCIPKVPA
ncbi:MAG: ABC transporter ATP-binding protein [Chitinophagaceae bacterium]|nr:ABC transporter ATP-binding protein [Chitinophagaceae bacterium]